LSCHAVLVSRLCRTPIQAISPVQRQPARVSLSQRGRELGHQQGARSMSSWTISTGCACCGSGCPGWRSGMPSRADLGVPTVRPAAALNRLRGDRHSCCLATPAAGRTASGARRANDQAQAATRGKRLIAHPTPMAQVRVDHDGDVRLRCASRGDATLVIQLLLNRRHNQHVPAADPPWRGAGRPSGAT